MELYINWIAGAGQTHDVFYTDTSIISSYRKLPSPCQLVDHCSICHREICKNDRRAVQELTRHIRVGTHERSPLCRRSAERAQLRTRYRAPQQVVQAAIRLCQKLVSCLRAYGLNDS